MIERFLDYLIALPQLRLSFGSDRRRKTLVDWPISSSPLEFIIIVLPQYIGISVISMAEEANERSALLQNGHAREETEVRYVPLKIKLPKSQDLSPLEYILSLWLMAVIDSRIYRERQGEPKELVQS